MKSCAASLKESHKHEVSTTAGIFVTFFNCGRILSISSLHGSESLSEVYMHVVSFFENHGERLPNEFGYDDGCHLRRFSEIRKDVTEKASPFWERIGKRIYVDRFHFKKHKRTNGYCQEHCNPKDNESIVNANTEICEQSFRWFARHKYSLNHMSPARFRFFLLLMADRRNDIRLEKKK